MNKFLTLTIVFILFCYAASAQTIENKGKPITEIFTDFHYSINDTAITTGFGLNRAYFGYNFPVVDNFTASVILNVGSPDELSSGSVHRRYAYFREASLSWTKNKINFSFGITSTRLFDFQQKFWGKRYISNTYQSINGYGFVADLGIAVDYKFNDFIGADLTIMNGEGFSELQLDNSVKTSVGLTITPNKQWALRFYGDITNPDGVMQNTLVGFVGFKNKRFMIGVETSYKSNLDLTQGHNAWGFSGTGGINISEKAEIFLRYDNSESAIEQGDVRHWNFLNDGSLTISGIQYTFRSNVKMALNYQRTNPYDDAKKVTDAIYLNALFKF